VQEIKSTVFDYDYFVDERSSIDVIETNKNTWTGLYTHKGDLICRSIEPIGFKIRKNNEQYCTDSRRY
jgi:hypothetical protein